jgi:hypothetical protein
MKRTEFHDLALGAALIILGYALVKHFQAQPAASITPTVVQATPAQAVEGNYTTSGPTSPFTSLADLLSGTVHDIGGFGGQNYLAGIENTDTFQKVGYW